MPFDYSIKINRPAAPGQPASFSPQNQKTSVGDIVSWSNRDTENHWPVPTDADGNIIDQNGFMTTAIAPNGTSDGYVIPNNPKTTIYYCCFYHPDARGTIEIS